MEKTLENPIERSTDKAAGFPGEWVLHVKQEIQIAAPLQIVFDAILAEAGLSSTNPNGEPMNLKLEAWPGGRWFRDLGKNTGHLWGHVQVIKPPKLLELTGPMFMSYPVMSHIQYKLTENADGTLLALNHRAVGEIAAEHRKNVSGGWTHVLAGIKSRAER